MSKQKRLQAGYAGHAVPAGQAKNAPEEGRMQQSRLISLIEETAPPALAAPWDKSGIQVASPRTEILHLAVSLDPAPDVVSAAVGLGADMLLTHHPLSLSARFPDRLDGYRRTLALLLAHDMPHYAAHTSLDANPFGPSVWLSDELGLTGRSVLEATGVARLPDGREIAGGFGCVGDLPDAPAPEVFFMKMGELLSSCGAFRANLIGTLPRCVPAPAHLWRRPPSGRARTSTSPGISNTTPLLIWSGSTPALPVLLPPLMSAIFRWKRK